MEEEKSGHFTKLPLETIRENVDAEPKEPYTEAEIVSVLHDLRIAVDNKNEKLGVSTFFAQIDYDEGAHDALIDARNTARLFEKVQREEVLTLSPYLIRSDMADSYSFNPFRNACRVGAC